MSKIALFLTLILNCSLAYGQNTFSGTGYTITYTQSAYSSINYSTNPSAPNCGYQSSDWTNDKVIKVGPGNITVDLTTPTTYISFDYGAMDNNETITFVSVNGGGTVTFSTPTSGNTGCFTLSNSNLLSSSTPGSNGKVEISSTQPFTQIVFSATGLYQVMKVNNFSVSNSSNLPQITSIAHSNITSSTATISADVTSDGGSAITERGFYYGTTATPTSNKTTVSGTTGPLSANLTGLSGGTTYYYRGFATNSNGTAYTADGTFTTTSTSSIICPEIDRRNNGNGQAGSCAGVNGTPMASNVVGTAYATVPTSAKTGDITFRWPNLPSAIPVITKVWINGVEAAAQVGPPSATTQSGGFFKIEYCFYNVNLPNAGKYTLEFTDPQTNTVLGRCTFDGSSNVSTSEPTLTTNTPPVITGPNGSGTTTSSTAAKSIPENTLSVGTYSADKTVTWSIGGTDASKFTITPTGELSFVNAPDYENPTDSDSNNTYIVVITATDEYGLTTTQTLTVTVTNVDEVPPTITGPDGNGTTTGSTANKSIPENKVNVYTFTANESVTWSISGGADQAKFVMDPNTGALRFVSPPDYETPTDADTDNVYIVEITAVDGAGNATTQTVEVTVTFVCGGTIYGTGYLSNGTGRDANWKIVALPQGFTPSESIPYNSYVINGILPAYFYARNGFTDADGDTFYWVAPKSNASSLLPNNAHYNWIIEQTFTVPRSGFYDLNFSGAGDNEIGFYINGSIDDSDPVKPVIVGGTQIGATWNTFTSSTTFSGKTYLNAGVNHAYMVMRDYGGLTTAIISGGSFTCTPLINGPTDGLASTISIPENSTDVFTFTSDESVTWSLSGGEDAAKFSINANGELVFVNAPDFENPTDGTTSGSNTYIVKIKALSTLTGLFSEQTLTVTVTDLDEIAPVITGPNGSGTTTAATAAKSIPENTTAVGSYSANESVTWSISGTDASKFTITPSGVLSFINAPDFENPTDAGNNNTYVVVITATDAAGNTTTQTLTVTVTDIFENLAPTDITLSKLAIYEGNALDAVIGLLSSTDPNAGDTHTYTLVNGAGSDHNDFFSIQGNQLRAGIVFNFNNQLLYSIRIRTTDAGGLSYEEIFLIEILKSPYATGTGNISGPGQITANGYNVTISKGLSAPLNISGSGLVSYSWSPATGLSATNIANPVATPLQTTTYAVTVTNSQGISTVVYVTVTVVEDYNVKPNTVITPNGDGKNDRWVISNLLTYPNNQVQVYDKAGRLLLNKTSYQNDWDGTINGSPLTEGTYYYVIKFDVPQQQIIKGYLTIIRD